jgi:hypothetical protein
MKFYKIIAAFTLLALFILMTGCMIMPEACIEGEDRSATAGTSVSFNSCSINAHHLEWNFGDGGKSSETNPSHIYNTAGTYTVTLHAHDKKSKHHEHASVKVTVQ